MRLTSILEHCEAKSRRRTNQLGAMPRPSGRLLVDSDVKPNVTRS